MQLYKVINKYESFLKYNMPLGNKIYGYKLRVKLVKLINYKKNSQ